MKEDKFVLLINDGVYHDDRFKNVFNYDKLKEIISKEMEDRNQTEVLVDSYGTIESYSLDDILQFMLDFSGDGELVKMTNLFIAYGDDYSEVGVILLEE